MSQSVPVDVLSDDDEPQNDVVSTPFPVHLKRQRTETLSNPTVFVIDDDPTPRKSAGSAKTPSFVPETPFSGLSDSDIAIVNCSKSDPQVRVFSSSDQKYHGISGMICLESDNESENCPGISSREQNETVSLASIEANGSVSGSRFMESSSIHGVTEEHITGYDDLTQMSGDSSSHPLLSEYNVCQIRDFGEEMYQKEQMGNVSKWRGKGRANENEGSSMGEVTKTKRKRMTMEERIRLKEEKKRQKEEEKLQKEALKAEAVEIKKLEKERQKWVKGKFALKSIVAEIDTDIAESGSVGGHLLTRFAEKGLTYRITSNPIKRSIVWSMTVPEQISQLSSGRIEIPYVLLVYEAEDFCKILVNQSLMDHVSLVRSCYSSHTVCYLTNRLMAYINKREQAQYKNPTNNDCGWRRPPVEEVLSKLTTNFAKVHSRQCVDEAEIAEHVVGLTSSLASCQFRKKLTRLSVNANGSVIPKGCTDKNLIKDNMWLKALVAIPKVQPRFAIAIWKKYPTMKSLLCVYMDPTKSVHEKEFLLQNLTTEGLIGEDRRLGEICSKRVYRILMAQCGSMNTDDVEDGADFFRHSESNDSMHSFCSYNSQMDH